MGYLRQEDFQNLVEIVRHSTFESKIEVLAHRIEEMDAMMMFLKGIQNDGGDADPDFQRQMMEKWVTLVEFSRACQYLLDERKGRVIPRIVRDWLQGVVENEVGGPVEITDIQELSEEEFNSYLQAGPLAGEPIEIDELGEPMRPNPFVQADGTVYPHAGSIRMPGAPRFHAAHTKTAPAAQNAAEQPIAGVSDTLGQPFLDLFRDLDSRNTKPKTASE